LKDRKRSEKKGGKVRHKKRKTMKWKKKKGKGDGAPLTFLATNMRGT